MSIVLAAALAACGHPAPPATPAAPDGAALVAARPDDVGALQSELRMHAQHLANGNCKMAM